jgi:hypothetical protein
MKLLPELTSYLEGLPEPHILFDTQYRILAANAAYREQFSPGRSVVGRTCYEVSHHFTVPCDRAGESCPLARSRESGQRERVLHLHHTPKGEEYVATSSWHRCWTRRGQQAYFMWKRWSRCAWHAGPAGRAGADRPCARAFQQMLALVARVAPSMATVLLLGRIRHRQGAGGPRGARDQPARAPARWWRWIAPACPRTLFESELFGHERGAFTGATTARAGLVEAASGGTLVSGRGGRHPAADASQAAAPAGNRHLPARGQHRAAPRRHPRRVGHPPPPGPDGPRRALPRRPVLPAQHLPDRAARAARAPRRHPGAGLRAAGARGAPPKPAR